MFKQWYLDKVDPICKLHFQCLYIQYKSMRTQSSVMLFFFQSRLRLLCSLVWRRERPGRTGGLVDKTRDYTCQPPVTISHGETTFLLSQTSSFSLDNSLLLQNFFQVNRMLWIFVRKEYILSHDMSLIR